MRPSYWYSCELHIHLARTRCLHIRTALSDTVMNNGCVKTPQSVLQSALHWLSERSYSSLLEGFQPSYTLTHSRYRNEELTWFSHGSMNTLVFICHEMVEAAGLSSVVTQLITLRIPFHHTAMPLSPYATATMRAARARTRH